MSEAWGCGIDRAINARLEIEENVIFLLFHKRNFTLPRSPTVLARFCQLVQATVTRNKSTSTEKKKNVSMRDRLWANL